MPKAMHAGSTLALNSSNHPSIPATGLELIADTAILVTTEQAVYLRTLPNVTVVDDPIPTPTPTPAPASVPVPIRTTPSSN